MEAEVKNNKLWTLFLGIFIACLILGIFAIDLFYFSNSGQNASDTILQNDPLQADVSQYQQLKRALLDDQTFNGLRRNGDWPIDPAKIKKGTAKPFVENKSTEAKNNAK